MSIDTSDVKRMVMSHAEFRLISGNNSIRFRWSSPSRSWLITIWNTNFEICGVKAQLFFAGDDILAIAMNEIVAGFFYLKDFDSVLSLKAKE